MIVNLCGMVDPYIVDPEGSFGKTGGCIGPNKKGFELNNCIGCQFYPKFEVLKMKLELLNEVQNWAKN
jgi:hypothetical protein